MMRSLKTLAVCMRMLRSSLSFRRPRPCALAASSGLRVASAPDFIASRMRPISASSAGDRTFLARCVSTSCCRDTSSMRSFCMPLNIVTR